MSQTDKVKFKTSRILHKPWIGKQEKKNGNWACRLMLIIPATQRQRYREEWGLSWNPSNAKKRKEEKKSKDYVQGL
jgi:hypothetical protein